MQGLVGIHGCYWVKKNGLKFYAVLTCFSILIELVLGSMTIIKASAVYKETNDSVTAYVTVNNNTKNFMDEYLSNSTYKSSIDLLHETLGCCIFGLDIEATDKNSSNYHDNITLVSSCFLNNFTQIAIKPFSTCKSTLTMYMRERLLYIRYISFLMVPLQLLSLFFDLLVLKTSQVTKDYEKLERELSNKARQRNTSYEIEESELLVEERVTLTNKLH